MPGFSDLFTPEGMNSLASNPMLNIGLALMAQGRQGSAAQALGRGGMVGLQAVQQAQHQQALQQYRDQMMQVQQQQMQMRQQAAQAETERQRQYQQRLQDPNFLNTLSPMARQMAQLGVDPADLIRATNADNLAQHRQATLQQDQTQFAQRQANAGAGGGSSGPRTPAPRPYIDQPVGNGMMQRHKYDAQTGDYAPWGEPFPQYSPGRKATTGPDAIVDSVLGAEEEPAPDTSALPGTAPLSAYAPGQQQAPIGVMPMSAAGGNAAAKPTPTMRVPNTRKPAASGDLAAAKSAIAAGKSRQAVVNRLMQAGYTADQIKEAGI